MPHVSRGGDKLEAAIARFDLAARIAGAQAIDVGASTGGFTERLLAHGAAHVTAIDVGHDQLHASLRDDARVTLIERTDFRKLALTDAPGPFDVFAVDVSFVAARGMLRPLAFRLRPGAIGIVLVKPQFELPDRGHGDEAARRAAALSRVHEKAGPLGFRVVEAFDSPVPGGEGTIEVLALLAFDGRTEKLPAPGEARRGKSAPRPVAVRASKLEGARRWFAVAAPGLEPLVLAEMSAIPGATQVIAVDGGTELSGDAATALRANLWARTASRLLLALGEAEAREFARLRRRIAALPWELVLPPGGAITVRASASRCRLYHTGAIAEQVTLGVADRIGPAAEGAEPLLVVVRGREDRFVVRADASGELLHRRGHRVDTSEAPLRETLAAAMLQLARWDPATPLLDPMCGAGTIPIEAALLALGRAPGLDRTFACEAWPGFPPGVAERVRAEARAAVRETLPAPILGFDRDPAAIEASVRNAARAGLESLLAFKAAGIGQVGRPPGPPGLVLVNPPFGKRVGKGAPLGALYSSLRKLLDGPLRGWRAGVLVADKRLLGAIGRPTEVHRLVTGGLPVHLALLEPAPPRVGGRPSGPR